MLAMIISDAELYLLLPCWAIPRRIDTGTRNCCAENTPLAPDATIPIKPIFHSFYGPDSLRERTHDLVSALLMGICFCLGTIAIG